MKLNTHFPSPMWRNFEIVFKIIITAPYSEIVKIAKNYNFYLTVHTYRYTRWGILPHVKFVRLSILWSVSSTSTNRFLFYRIWHIITILHRIKMCQPVDWDLGPYVQVRFSFFHLQKCCVKYSRAWKSKWQSVVTSQPWSYQTPLHSPNIWLTSYSLPRRIEGKQRRREKFDDESLVWCCSSVVVGDGVFCELIERSCHDWDFPSPAIKLEGCLCFRHRLFQSARKTAHYNTDRDYGWISSVCHQFVQWLQALSWHFPR